MTLSQDIKFSIERIEVKAKSRQLMCKCKSKDSYMTVKAREPSRITMKCDACREEDDYKFSFGGKNLVQKHAPDLLEERYRALLREALDAENKT